MTDGVIFLFVIGLAPEIPEDLYMLIKKVAFVVPFHLQTHSFLLKWRERMGS